MIRRVVAGTAVVLLVCTGLVWLWLSSAMTSPAGADAVVEVVIPEGASVQDALDLLHAADLVPSPWLVRLRAKLRGQRLSAGAGTYRFDRGDTPDATLARLAAGPQRPAGPTPLRVTIIPGTNQWQIAQRVAGLGLKGDLLQAVRDPRVVRAAKVPAPPRPAPGAHGLLEGYLFPDTYHLDRKRPEVSSLIKLATRRFVSIFAAVWAENEGSAKRLAKRHGFDRHDFVILASLVEKEVAEASEAPMVAAVFYNRLARGMRLQTDPTMVYGPDTWSQKPSPTFRRDASNPYNTYQHDGLPPGPICNPGRGALQAALAPATTKALYFVAMRDGTGRHAFAQTLSEHRANIDKYLR